VRIALDDFGTGYSSLNYLRSFPFDKIKIDKCFVSELNDNPDCQAIVRAVVDLASNLGMETTAEGVESREQLDRLRDKGCTEAQGYLFSRPERAEQFTDLRPARPRLTQASAPIVLPGSITETGLDSRARARAHRKRA
jgi:EAL domain-containing protein (putative c-di-GMP-specific phosphodiesterase class I)